MAVGDSKTCRCGSPYVQQWQKQSKCGPCRAIVHKVWRDNNRKKSAAAVHGYQKRARANGTMTVRFYFTNLAHAIKGYRRKKTDRVLEFDLDGAFLNELWDKQGGKCAASGMSMQHQLRHICSASVDRINNDGGYTRDNVRLVCKWANLARGSHTVEEFAAVIATLRSPLPHAS